MSFAIGIGKKVIDLFYKKTSAEKLYISETSPVYAIGLILGNDDDRQQFFDSLLAAFETFDQHNQLQKNNEQFIHDIKVLIGYATCSIECDKFNNRGDAYFYLLRRLEEYTMLIRSSTYLKWHEDHNIKSLREMILVHTKQSFFYSNGLEPNFSIQ
ncbi:unnamed protein product, partial [Didymodactylos carnosus]